MHQYCDERVYRRVPRMMKAHQTNQGTLKYSSDASTRRLISRQCFAVFVVLAHKMFDGECSTELIVEVVQFESVQSFVDTCGFVTLLGCMCEAGTVDMLAKSSRIRSPRNSGTTGTIPSPLQDPQIHL